MIELYKAPKVITMLCLIRNILRFNLRVAYLKSVSINANKFNLKKSKKKLTTKTSYVVKVSEPFPQQKK